MIRFAAALTLAALLATGCATRRGPATGEATADTATLAGRTAVLGALERAVREQHVDPLFASDRFPAALERAQAPLLAAGDAATFQSRLQAFVAGFGDPHFALLPPGADEAGLEVPGPGLLGASGREVEGRLFVADLHEGGPAAAAGLRRGDEVVATDGGPPRLDPLPAGPATRRLLVRRAPEEEPSALDITLAPGGARAAAVAATRASTGTLTAGSCRVGRIHLRTFADRDLVDDLTTADTFEETDGLVLDLRGNDGGELRLAGELLDLLTRAPSVQIRWRGRSYPFPSTSWNRPLVLIVDGSTRSAAEVFAAAVQARRLGVVLGEPTAGQVRGSRLAPLPDGSRLLLPVSDILLPDGEPLEGRGVGPDLLVTRPLAWSADADPPWDSALQALISRMACPEHLPADPFGSARPGVP